MEAAFFDLDKTIIAGSSTLAFGRPLYRAGFLQRRALMRAGIAQISYVLFGADEDSLERARDEMLDLVSGWRRAEIEAIVADGEGRNSVWLAGQGMRVTGMGLVVGAAAAWFLTRLVQSLLFDVSATRTRTARMSYIWLKVRCLFSILR